MSERIDQIIESLDLSPHPEGGYFKEVYRSDGTTSTPYGERNYSTSIYFLLTFEAFSAFHKINQDEGWHFYEGAPIKVHMISPDGEYSFVTLGNDLNEGQVYQYIVPGGHWFAAEVIEQDSYSLVGCTVAPGFDFADFVLPERKNLIDQFPNHSDVITRLTR